MKKICFLLAFCSLAVSNLAMNADAQVPIPTPMNNPDRLFSPDPYPLIDGSNLNWKGNTNDLLLRAPYNDPGILLPPMNWDCDPGILLMPKFNNCDPGIIWKVEVPQTMRRIPTYDIYMTPALNLNPLITPFLLPGEDILRKNQELHDAGRLRLLDDM